MQEWRIVECGGVWRVQQIRAGQWEWVATFRFEADADEFLRRKRGLL